jgi:type IV secretory pathway VirB4 component
MSATSSSSRGSPTESTAARSASAEPLERPLATHHRLARESLDADLLAEQITSATRDLGAVVDAPISRGHARQPDLWTSSLPLALDAAKRGVRMISRNAADSVTFLSTSCGSPDGIPFAFADPGRTLERLNPFDRAHDNATTLLFAKAGGGKTMTTIALTSAALPRGCQVNVIDRSAGHWEFLTMLIPGAAHLELGGETGATINPWDVEDLASVPRSKVAFLVRLHALLVGDHDTAEDAYGLGPLERNLLAVAIRRTYDRAAKESTTPRESLLRETLHHLARDEATSADGSPENPGVYRNLAHRLGEFCADGTYGYLFDRPTTIAADDAPLAVFNTRQIPDDVAAPALFAVLECISRRVERRHEAHLRRLAEGRPSAARSTACPPSLSKRPGS